MEQSNSSNSNPNNNQPSNEANQPQTSNETNSSMQAHQPSKPLKIKGKFKPKTPQGFPPSQDQPFQQPNFEANDTSNQAGQAPYYGQPTYGNYPPYPGAPYPEVQTGKLKHSGPGIASFIISLISLLTIVVGFVIIFASIVNLDEADLMLFQNPSQEYIDSLLSSGDNIPSVFVSITIGGFFMLVSGGIAFIGFILGLIGLFIKNRKKVFAILGTIFNGLIMFGGIILLLLSFVGALAG